MNGNTIQLHRTIKILLKWPICFIILLFCTVLLKIAFVKHCAIIQCHLPFVERELKTQTRARALETTTLGRYMYAQLKSQLVQGRPFDLLNVILTACLWTTMSRMNFKKNPSGTIPSYSQEWNRITHIQLKLYDVVM